MHYRNHLELTAFLHVGNMLFYRDGTLVEMPYFSPEASYLGRMWNAVAGIDDVSSELRAALNIVEVAFARAMEEYAAGIKKQSDHSRKGDFVTYTLATSAEDNYEGTLGITLKEDIALIQQFIRDNKVSPHAVIKYLKIRGEEVTSSPLRVDNLRLDIDKIFEVQVLSDVKQICLELEKHEIEALLMQLLSEEIKSLLGKDPVLIRKVIVLMTQGAEFPTLLHLKNLYCNEEGVDVFSKSGNYSKHRCSFEILETGEVLLKINKAYLLMNTEKVEDVIKILDTMTIFNLSDLKQKVQVSIQENPPASIIEGIGRMKSTLMEAGESLQAELVNRVMYRMQRSYQIVQNLTDKNHTLKAPEQLHDLENSMMLSDETEQGSTLSDSLFYLHRKLEFFLLTRDYMLTPYQIEIVKSLRDELEDNLSNQFIYSRHDFEVFEKDRLNIAEMVNRKLLRLDHLKGIAAEVGICCSSGFVVGDYDECTITVHQAPMGVRREGNKYIVNAYNAGWGALGKISKSNPEEGQTVVEFAPLAIEVVSNFLFEALVIYYQHNRVSEALKGYQQIFDTLTPVEIFGLSDRPFQRMGNCGIRNHLEWMIYTLQRLGEVKLANEIVHFQVTQDDTAHPKSPIKSLNKKDEEDFFII